MASCAPGSRILFTYVDRAVLDDGGAFEGARRLFAHLDRVGERWTFGLAPAELPAYLDGRGLRLLEELGSVEYRRRTLGERPSLLRGYAFYRLALAEVR
jgi:O-methyltransferase involved in polyketide biosynthesis